MYGKRIFQINFCITDHKYEVVVASNLWRKPSLITLPETIKCYTKESRETFRNVSKKKTFLGDFQKPVGKKKHLTKYLSKISTDSFAYVQKYAQKSMAHQLA